MDVPKLYRISAEVERDQRARFRVFSKSQGRTMRAQLTYMVGQAIAGVELPKEQPRPAHVAPHVDEPERLVFYQRGLTFQIPIDGEQDDYMFAPDSDYRQYRAAGDSPEIARKRVEFSCEGYRVDGWTPPPEPKIEEES